ncbi:MAG TPA: iron-containing alcohol dehydrogenase, partial [Victivallales bacterium]|nr:iron-containing alcohol dehydrogenase [Victivallales bacterium]
SEDEVLSFFESYPESVIVPEPGALLGIQTLLVHEPKDRMLVVCGGKSSIENGFRKKFNIVMDDIDCDIEFFEGISAEPDIEEIGRLKKSMDELLPDIVVAAGGGSVMDAAKAAYLVHQIGGDIRDYFGLNKVSSSSKVKDIKKILCVPTTAGTGSEVTHYSNVMDMDEGVKKIIADKEIIPSHAFIDSSLCLSCPRELTLNTACDALSHAIEAYLGLAAESSEYDKWALASVRLIAGALPTALNDPNDKSARKNLSYAATLAGMAIRFKPTGIPHLLSYPFSRVVPHGIAVASLLPAAWKYYCGNGKVSEKTAILKGVFGEGEKPLEIIEDLQKFLILCGVPSKLSAIKGVNQELMQKSVDISCNNKAKLATIPRPIPEADVKKTLSKIIEDAG